MRIGENDPLGGKDPYSASKAMVEMATKAYQQSFFSKSDQIAVAESELKSDNEPRHIFAVRIKTHPNEVV